MGGLGPSKTFQNESVSSFLQIQFVGLLRFLIALLGASWLRLGRPNPQNGRQTGPQSGPKLVQKLVQEFVPEINPIRAPKCPSKWSPKWFQNRFSTALGPQLGPSSPILAHLGLSWGTFVASCGYIGPSWVLLRHSWILFGIS